MYCPSCGKNVPDNSKFCLYCGKNITIPEPSSDKQVEWEYQDFLIKWGARDGGRYFLKDGENENTIRLKVWNNSQSWILPKIQELLDNGWQPVTQVGPPAFSFRYREERLHDNPYLEVEEFKVTMRKPKQNRTSSAGSVSVEPSKYSSRPDYDEKIREFLKQGKKLEAIKFLRSQETGMGLKEALEYVDDIERSV